MSFSVEAIYNQVWTVICPLAKYEKAAVFSSKFNFRPLILSCTLKQETLKMFFIGSL